MKMKYTVQYSTPSDARIAVSDWLERETTVEAESLKEAQAKANKKFQHLGTWMILDCYPEQTS